MPAIVARWPSGPNGASQFTVLLRVESQASRGHTFRLGQFQKYHAARTALHTQTRTHAQATSRPDETGRQHQRQDVVDSLTTWAGARSCARQSIAPIETPTKPAPDKTTPRPHHTAGNWDSDLDLKSPGWRRRSRSRSRSRRSPGGSRIRTGRGVQQAQYRTSPLILSSSYPGITSKSHDCPPFFFPPLLPAPRSRSWPRTRRGPCSFIFAVCFHRG